MLIYDFEIFKHDTLLGVLNEETGEIFQSWDIDEIKDFTKKNLNNIWVGYNSDHYDKILLHGMLTNKLNNEDKIFECSTVIIGAQDDNIPIFNLLNKFNISDYYQSPILSYDLLGDRFIFFT